MKRSRRHISDDYRLTWLGKKICILMGKIICDLLDNFSVASGGGGTEEHRFLGPPRLRSWAPVGAQSDRSG